MVGVWTEGTSKDADNSLKELAALAETAGSQVMDALIQRRDKPDPATFIGSGKVAEVRQAVVATGADTVICDGELSPAQLRTLEQKVKVKVVVPACQVAVLNPLVDILIVSIAAVERHKPTTASVPPLAIPTLDKQVL